jgi:phospholipid/cholesterol/gamma-HCH transport system permease protein
MAPKLGFKAGKKRLTTYGAYVILKKCQLPARRHCCNQSVAAMVSPLEAIGHVALAQVQGMGRMAVFLGSACFWAVLPPLKLRRVVRQIHFIGVKSVSVILLTALFTGMVLGLQGYYTLRKFGSEGLLGTAVALSLIRELGPVMAALMVTARAGSATAAEIGIMRITEQIDALRAMAVNPMKYLVVPRVIAGLIALPLLTSIFDVVGIFGGYLVGVKLLGLSSGIYFSEMRNAVEMSDITGGILKSLSFGIIVTWVCTYKGYYTGYGAEGVGKATTEAVVLSSVLVLVWDYFMTSFLF